MRLKDLMKKQVVSVSADTCISDVAKEMVRSGFGFLPVLDHGRAIGVVTGKDLATRAAARGLGLDSAAVTVIMSFPPLCALEDEDLYAGLRMMKTHGVRRILIVDRDGAMSGLVSLADIEAGITQQIEGELRHVDSVEAESGREGVTIPGLYLG